MIVPSVTAGSRALCVCRSHLVYIVGGPNVPTRIVKPEISYRTLWGPANSSHEENGLINLLFKK